MTNRFFALVLAIVPFAGPADSFQRRMARGSFWENAGILLAVAGIVLVALAIPLGILLDRRKQARKKRGRQDRAPQTPETPLPTEPP